MEYLYVFTPLLLHYGLSVFATVVLSGKADAAATTAFTGILSIPIGIVMWKGDLIRWKQKEELQNWSWGRMKNWNSVICFGGLCFLGGAVLNWLYSSLLTMIHIQELFSNQIQENLLSSEIILQVIGLGVVVPIAEELIFRGLVYKRMRHLAGAKWAILFSALLFALYHGNPIQMIYVFPMALVLAGVYQWGGALVYPILFHMGANLLAVLFNFLN